MRGGGEKTKTMISFDYIRENTEKAKEGFAAKKCTVDVDALLALDEEYRAALAATEQLRAQRNVISDQIASASEDERSVKIKEAEEIKAKLQESEQRLDEASDKREEAARTLPNLPFDVVPRGEDESANEVLRSVGEVADMPFEVKDSSQLGQMHDLIDTERAAKVSGSRFGYIKNEAALLEFALVRMALDEAAKEGFAPIVPPVLIGEQAMRGLGYLDKEPDQIYHLPEDDLYLVATAEHAIVPMLAGETLQASDTPKRYIGFSSAFRREAGTYGKDTKGILRVHQFDKVEMVTFAAPETSNDEHQLMLSIQERLMQKLEIPYQVVHVCTGDMGFTAANQYDIESWIPSEGRYRETHSTSNTTDFQSRRLGIRVKTGEGSEFAHVLNGTAFAIGRTLIALLENHQQADGSIAIPEALRPYTGFDRIG